MAFPLPFQQWPAVGQRWPKYNTRSKQALGLVALLPPASIAGSAIYDLVRAQHLELFGITTEYEPEIGSMMRLTGAVTSYAIANPYDFPTSALSVSFWVKTTTSGEGLISYGVGSGDAANEFSIINQADLNVYINGGSPWITGVAVNDGALHNIVITWEAQGGNTVLYVDGVLAAGPIARSTVALTNGGALVLGQDQDALGGGFQAAQAYDGLLGEVRLYNRVLSASEAQDIYDPKTRWELYEIPRRLWAFAPPPAAGGTILPQIMQNYYGVYG